MHDTALSIMRNLHRKTCNSIIARKQFFFNGMNALKQHCKNMQIFLIIIWCKKNNFTANHDIIKSCKKTIRNIVRILKY